uniref:Uncharacterized protein n=1 Tax=Anguilla anguilla TaxID=7936 RepID=A0A0E9UBC4_ANGAN
MRDKVGPVTPVVLSLVFELLLKVTHCFIRTGVGGGHFILTHLPHSAPSCPAIELISTF